MSSESAPITASTFFSAAPQSLLDDICNCSEDHMMMKLTELERAMKVAVPGNAPAIAEATDRILSYLRKRFHTYFGLFEQYANKNIFFVPDLDFSTIQNATPTVSDIQSSVSEGEPCACLPASAHAVSASSEQMQLDALIRVAQTKLHSERFVTQAMKTELAQLQIELAQYAEVAPALHAVASCYYPINGVAPLGSAALKAMGIASEELEAEVKSIQKLAESSNLMETSQTTPAPTAAPVPSMFALAASLQ